MAGWVFWLCFLDGLLIAEIETNFLIGLLIAKEGFGVRVLFFLVWLIGVFAKKWPKRVGGSDHETQQWVTEVCGPATVVWLWVCWLVVFWL
jgi:hypothetical protein